MSRHLSPLNSSEGTDWGIAEPTRASQNNVTPRRCKHDANLCNGLCPRFGLPSVVEEGGFHRKRVLILVNKEVDKDRVNEDR
jgi:hypothetical protein